MQRRKSWSDRSVHYSEPLRREVHLQVHVNLKLVLPHQRRQQLLNVDPELDYPILRIVILRIVNAKDLQLPIDDIKQQVCNMLWDTLTISLEKRQFCLRLQVFHHGQRRC